MWNLAISLRGTLVVERFHRTGRALVQLRRARSIQQIGRLPIWSGLYGETAVDLVGLALEASPLDCLVIVTAPERHFFAANGDDNIALGSSAVPSYPHFGGMFGDP